MKYFIETYGCQMNVHDSERMAGLLEQAGYESTAEARDADVVVINTCSVRERAEDIPYLTAQFVRDCAARLKRPITELSREVERPLPPDADDRVDRLHPEPRHAQQ